ncbi:MAG: sulfite exporter TauE/SafE family protein [Akkermansiaceae bacterium]|nr:sulfite exporter TauE/SafE family protein [Armatimonadota bacterium]
MTVALPDLLPWQWCVAALGAFLVGVSKTGIAGVGIVSVALFPLVWEGKNAVGVALLILICADVVAIAAYPPKNVRWDIWRSVFPWAALGVLFGALAMRYISDPSTIKRIIGGILLLIVTLQLILRAKRTVQAGSSGRPAVPNSGGDGGDIGARRSLVERDAMPPLPVLTTPELGAGGRPSSSTTILAGIVTGIATMVANAAGPVMILYLLPRKLPKVEFIATTAWFFFALNLFKVPFSVGAGMMDAASPMTAALLLPAAVIGGLTGKWLLPRIEQNTFELSALILTALASVRLLLG